MEEKRMATPATLEGIAAAQDTILNILIGQKQANAPQPPASGMTRADAQAYAAQHGFTLKFSVNPDTGEVTGQNFYTVGGIGLSPAQPAFPIIG